MQICKKKVSVFALLLIITNSLFSQISVPSVSSPTISGPTAPQVPSIGTNSSTQSTNTNSFSSSSQSSTDNNISSDLTAEAINTLSSLFGSDEDLLGSGSSNDIYSLLNDELLGTENNAVNSLVLEQILTKLDEIEKTLKTTSPNNEESNLKHLSITKIKTQEESNLLAKTNNTSLTSQGTNGSFLLSGIIDNPNSDNEIFYIDFKPINTHTYEVNFTVHTNNSNSILKEMASHGPYKASKTANFVTMSIFGPEYYLDLVLTVDF